MDKRLNVMEKAIETLTQASDARFVAVENKVIERCSAIGEVGTKQTSLEDLMRQLVSNQGELQATCAKMTTSVDGVRRGVVAAVQESLVSASGGCAPAGSSRAQNGPYGPASS